MTVPRFQLWIFAPFFAAQIFAAPLEENADYQAAIQALADQVPAVATEKLTRIYRTPEDLSPEDLATVASRLLESMVRQERFVDALALCQEKPLERHPAMPFWKGVALARLGNHSEAEQHFRYYEGLESDPRYIYATLTRANLLISLNEPESALQVLAPLRSPSTIEAVRLQAAIRSADIYLDLDELAEAEKILKAVKGIADDRSKLEIELLEAKRLLAKGDLNRAERQFRSVLEKSKGTNARVHHRSQLGLADVNEQKGETDDAVDRLVQFVSQSQDSPLLPSAFERLESLKFFERDRPHPMLQNWQKSPKPELQGLTLFHSARQTKLDTASKNLEAFVAKHPNHFLADAATIRLAELYVESANPEKATELLDTIDLATLNPGIRHFVAYVRGRAEFALNNFSKAADAFGLASGEEAENPNAVFNAAVAALYGQNQQRYLEEFRQLGLQEKIASAQSDLRLERALKLAADSDPNALNELKAFASDHPEHLRVAEAELALAEIYLLEFLPVAARKQLITLRQRDLSNKLAERADYVSIWIEATTGNEEGKAVELGKQFLKAWPKSQFRSEVRMKLGEIYYAAKDFPNARDQFQRLAEEDPQGPLHDTALFFAGKAAQSTMNAKSLQNAIELWGRVVDAGGPLAEEALRHQALATLKMGKADDSIRVLNKLLENEKSLDLNLRLAVLLNKGQAATRKAADSPDPRSMLVSAIASFDRILDSPGASRFWKNQAAVHKARCLEQLPDDGSALEVYYDVISQAPTLGLSPEEIPEYTWFYRAGFSAIGLLQKQEQWGAAIRLADRLAQTGGTRAIEAARLADKLRLEHFFWDEAE